MAQRDQQETWTRQHRLTLVGIAIAAIGASSGFANFYLNTLPPEERVRAGSEMIDWIILACSVLPPLAGAALGLWAVRVNAKANEHAERADKLRDQETKRADNADEEAQALKTLQGSILAAFTPTRSIRIFHWLKRPLPQVNGQGTVTVPFQVWNLSPRKWKVESLSFVSVNAGGVLCAGEVRSAQNQSVTLEPHQSDLSALSVTISGIEGSGQIWLEFVGGSFRATSDTADSETVPMNPHVPVFVLVEKVQRLNRKEGEYEKTG